ncbi:Sarcosine oxidase, delta subunit [Sulfitobacter noctilucae]|nr:Sarcosine oxidase, delta subunit [Sulfitobacter noctilucae]
MLARPGPDAGEVAWDNYLHLRDNPAGVTEELWQHDGGCGSWLVVTRDTVSHVISKVEMAADVKRAMQAAS